ncbi:Nitrogen fixation protein rnfC [uncultured Flavonifractor sp.]|nr:Nitrogen fixation protein rnfC [uncultured Flavonifractor sp.]
MFSIFSGGIRPAQRKKATAQLPFRPMTQPPAQVVLPLAGPGTAAAVPLVAPGDRVRVGQKLADAIPGLAAVHASVSGTVAAVELRPQLIGGAALSVVIDNDGKDTPVASPDWRRVDKDAAPASLRPGELADIAAQAGLTTMDGTGRPLSQLLRSAIGKADTLIIDGTESEPFVTSRRRLMADRPEAVLGGVRLLMQALSLPRAVLALEGSQYDAVAALRGYLPLRGGDIELRLLRSRYPQRVVIQEEGRALFTACAAAALWDAVYQSKALTHRIVTVTGSAVTQPANLLVPIGTPISDLIREAGGWKGEPVRLVAGGPMTGRAQHDLSAPVTGDTRALLALSAADLYPSVRPESPCLRCGRCVEACPAGLAPLFLHLYVRKGQWEALEREHISACSECGACAYVCPAHLRLVHSIRVGKRRLSETADGREADHEEKA